jgi:hypothetical protein
MLGFSMTGSRKRRLQTGGPSCGHTSGRTIPGRRARIPDRTGKFFPGCVGLRWVSEQTTIPRAQAQADAAGTHYKRMPRVRTADVYSTDAWCSGLWLLGFDP